MERLHRRHKRHANAADLDVTPFMNLMIVLVPVLLLSMVFTHTSVIDLNFPAGDSADAAFDPESVHLEVIVREHELVVADGRGGQIKAIPILATGHDFETLSLVMQEVKRRLPEKREVTVLLEARTDYQTLVSVMDRVRSYATVQAMEVVQAELFPVISLGDTPVLQPTVQKVAAAGSGTGKGV